MKSNRLPVFALGVLTSISASSQAQPNAAQPEPRRMPTFKLSESNTDAMALIGEFYSKMRRAQSGRVHVVATKTVVNEGKVVSTKVFDIQSSWIGDAKREGLLSKGVSKFSFSLSSDDKATTDKFTTLDDGTKTYRFNETKNVWSERNQELSEVAMPLPLTRISWMTALSCFGVGREFKIERKTVDGQDQLFLSSPYIEYVFDVKSGNLKSWTVTNAGETTEIRWLETEFNQPLPDSQFKWMAPEGATQVAPETMKMELQF